MRKILFIVLIMANVCFYGCQQLEESTLSSGNEMTSLKCILQTGTNKDSLEAAELNLITSSNMLEVEKGNIKYIMDTIKYTRTDYGRARFEAIIPATASIVEKDAMGNIIAKTIGYRHDVYKKVLYFYVIAADGTEKKYTVRFTTN